MPEVIVKKIIFIALGFVLSACATTEELKSRPSCVVWEDQGPLGPNSVDVQNNRVEKKGKCMFLFWGCAISTADIDNAGEIYVQNPGLFSNRTKVAQLKGQEVIYETSGLDSIVKSSPVKLDLENKTASRKVSMQVILHTESEEELHFNGQCNVREAALGAVGLWVFKNVNR